jgi:NosR/NirI family nitrous oxide reductase transcriptional regulator
MSMPCSVPKQFSRLAVTGAWWLLLSALLLGSMTPVVSAGFAEQYPQVRSFFPQADRFGELGGDPPAAAVYRGGTLLGYAFLTTDVVRIPAYSGKPITTLVGFDTGGRITGIEVVHHEEPILVIGISNERLQRFARQYVGKSVFDRIVIGGTREGYVTIDAISGATITMMVENASIMQSVRKVAESRGLRPENVSAPAASAVAAPDQARGSPPAAKTATAPKAAPGAGLSGRTPRPSTTRNTVTTSAGAVEEPIWIEVWRQRVFAISVLLAGLSFLTLILVFQDWLARHPKLLLYIRDGFLVYTLVFIGWYGLAQLSVVNVLTFTQSAMHGFQWESFLIDPMMFLLWSFVAVTLLLWGRGVYCGWLCPFGALQELSFQLARRLKIPAFEIPQTIHERLWALKYIILLALFGLSLQSLTLAERYTEVEPFKTAITLRFAREWSFVAYAAGLVVLSTLNRKFYCKYLCALGAALTIGGKFRIFDWLRRHRECGRPCQVCAAECEVQAIRKDGEINANECHYCLDCQVTYWNDQKCPPMVDRRKRREKSVRAREVVRGMESDLGRSGLEDIPVRVEPRRSPSGQNGDGRGGS